MEEKSLTWSHFYQNSKIRYSNKISTLFFTETNDKDKMDWDLTICPPTHRYILIRFELLAIQIYMDFESPFKEYVCIM